MSDDPNLDLRERIRRIDQMLADHDRKRQETWWYPVVVLISGLTAGAALIVTGAALHKFYGLL